MRYYASALLILAAVGNCCQAATAPTAQDMAKLAEGNNAFAADLYGRLEGKEGNLFYSPYSISTALAMTYMGARGETEKQMAATMHFELGQEMLHPAMAELQARLGSKEHQWKAYELDVANAMWVQTGYNLVAEFVKRMGIYYTDGLDTVDFQEPEKAAERINEWVERQTRDKIKQLFEPRIITRDTRLVLVNAIYFKGLWEKPFDRKVTRDADFHVSGVKTVKVPMMHMAGRAVLAGDDEKQILVLPYVGGGLRDESEGQAPVKQVSGSDLSMVILLPRRQDGLARAEEWLRPGVIDKLVAGARGVEAELAIPRFKMSGRFELSDTLRDMGMTDAFGSKADLSGMDGKRQLFISHVIHKAYVEVNEEGTEAAAATGVGIALTAAPVRDEPVRFIADHPFIFVIRDNRTHSTLFVGRVVNPTEGGDVK